MRRSRPPLLEGSRLAFASALLAGLGAGLAGSWGHLTLLQAGTLYLTLLSLLTFLLFAIDKRRARLDRRRVSVSNLLWLTCLGGGIGAWIGMRTLRHKTRTRSFRVLVPLASALQVAGLAYLAYRNYRA